MIQNFGERGRGAGQNIFQFRDTTPFDLDLSAEHLNLLRQFARRLWARHLRERLAPEPMTDSSERRSLELAFEDTILRDKIPHCATEVPDPPFL